MNNKATEIADPEVILKLKALIKPLITSPGQLSAKWLEDHNWVATNVESACHFDENDSLLLAEAMQKEGVYNCFAVVTDPLKNFPQCLTVEATKEGLLAFSQTCAHFNFLLIPASLSFAIFCIVFDYFTVSGPRSFVENAIGVRQITSAS